jgi:hypothetical protein
MNQALNTFKKWFKNLEPDDQLKIAQYIQRYSNYSTADFGIYGGPVPKNYSRICPTCGRSQ